MGLLSASKQALHQSIQFIQSANHSIDPTQQQRAKIPPTIQFIHIPQPIHHQQQQQQHQHPHQSYRRSTLSQQTETKRKDVVETPFGVTTAMVLLQAVLILSTTQSQTTQPAIFEQDNIALNAMHVIMQRTYVFYVHFVNSAHKHTQQIHTETAAAVSRQWFEEYLGKEKE